MISTECGFHSSTVSGDLMCGINGVVSAHGRVDVALLEQMADLVHHRGPDDRGVHQIGRAGFSHTRLSIVDPDRAQQPMVSHDGRCMVTFNGEIYNHVELRSELAAQGVDFATTSDTELLLRAYLHWGDSCVERFNGQWAFAVWDDERSRLFAARDRFGIRPFHYALAGSDLVFSSTIGAVRLHPGVTTRPDLNALDDIFTFWVPLAGRTFHEGISQLAPGHVLRFEDGRLETAAYWTLDFTESTEIRPESEYLEELEALMADSIRLRLRSDVSVGAYLSGGVDSALTTALVGKYSDAPLRTFSVTFDDAEFDEGSYQREVAAHLGTDHESVLCTAESISSTFAEVIRHVEQPILRTAPAPLHALSRLAASRGDKVVITGEGADELFGGYDIFKEAKVRRFWARDIESTIRPRLLKRLYPYMPDVQAQSPAYLQAFFQVSAETVASPLFSHLPRWNMTSKMKSFYSTEVAAALSTRDPYAAIADQLPAAFDGWSHFAQAQYLETAHLLPGYILSSQGDRMLMANSVEGRFPFLDHRVAEFATRLPSTMKMRGLDEKYLLKRLARGLVPDSVIERPKQPYRAPDAASFFDVDGRPRHDYVGDAMSERAVRDVELFDPARVAGLSRKCSSGRSMSVRDNQAFVGILSTQLLSADG